MIVSNEHIALLVLNEALTSYGIQMMGRKISMYEHIGSLPKRVKDPVAINEFSMKKVEIEYLTTGGFQSKLTAPTVTFELNGHKSR